MTDEDSQRRAAQLTKRLARFSGFMAEAAEIEARSAKEAGALGFYARLFVQAGMPHKDPKISTYGRTNGSLTLTMITDPAVGLPYGSMPRLLLAWTTTEAVRTKERHLVLGNALAGFLGELGLQARGGPRGEITRLKKQMRKTFSASVSCRYDGPGGWSLANAPVADRAELWWDPKRPDQAELWDSTVTLGQVFFESIIQHPVPVDLRALHLLTRSPLAIDLYVWLTYRMSYLHEPATVPWELLSAQTGAHYKDVRNFRARALAVLPKVLTVYPDARVHPLVDSQGVHMGLRIMPSPTHIPRRV